MNMGKVHKNVMHGKLLSLGVIGCIPFIILMITMTTSAVLAAGATTSLRIIRYTEDGTSILKAQTVTYQWMEQNLPVHGDGVTHYYHQGPIFEGDIWDPDETNNLKDKGAVKGTALRDLCDIVGGMKPGDEVAVYAVDGWHTEFAYSNVYEPSDRQGIITLCWYKGEGSGDEDFGAGYPGNDTYNAAIQIVFMAGTANGEGKYVFGNYDMKIALPEEKYQHFYEGIYPSTNGLSGKWITDIYIYNSMGKPDFKAAIEPMSEAPEKKNAVPWLAIALGTAGILLVGATFFRQRKRE
jgi:hypothetical protein